MGEHLDIKETIAVINEMQADGIIGEYAVGGAFAAIVHRVEIDFTDDIDVYIVLNPSPGQSLVSLIPIHRYLEARGYGLNRDGYPVIANWQVQFLPANKPLLKEALDESVVTEIDGVPVRVFTSEHLAAVAFDLGRPKDKMRLPRFLSSTGFDEDNFSKILGRHDMLDRWRKFKTQILD
jgi:hypothetical protein